MGQKDFSMSLIKKPCPRSKFPCNRCGAKIVNAGLQWEVTVPKYYGWYYLDPISLVQSADASDNPHVLYLDTVVPVEIDGVSTPCSFGGDAYSESYAPGVGGDPSPGDSWVQDFGWERYGGPVGWNSFSREHTAVIQFQAAEMDGDNLVTPGRWYAVLIIEQGVYRVGSHYSIAPGGYYRTIGFTLTEGSVSVIEGRYYKPEGASCIVDGVERWEREVPILPRLDNTVHTIDTLPAGYQWPSDLNGSFFPIGQPKNNNAYFAPPYLDIRHVKK